MLRWYPPVILQIVLELTFLPIGIVTIFAVNAASDPETPWIIGPLKGPGISGDFWLVVGFTLLGWLILYLGWRGAKTGFKLLIGLWQIGLTAGTLLLALDTGNVLFQGEAIGFTISIELLGPVFTGITLILLAIWISQDIKHGSPERSVSPFQRRNKIAFVIGVILLVMSGILFRLDSEEFGTIVGIVSVFAFRESLRPLNPSKELHKALTDEGSAPR